MRLLVPALLLATLPAFAESTAPAPTSPTPPAVEQPAPPMMPAVGTPWQNRREQQPRSPIAGNFAEFTAGKTAFLRAELGITPEQEPAFAAFIEILTRYTEGMNSHRATMLEQRRDMKDDNQLTLPTRLGLRIGGMEQDVQALKVLQRAIAEFYATLTDTQKKSADTLLGYLAH